MSSAGGGPSDWDATKYARVATPQREWSDAVLSRLNLEGTETVMDAGCGSGEVTAHLLERLPLGKVVAVDGSPSMLEKARKHLSSDRVEFVCQDLDSLIVEKRVDHVFSNATFHWISDHDTLFSRIRQAISPGGTLVAQCGGRGNVAEIVAALEQVTREEPYVEYVGSIGNPWNFASPDETEIRLIGAGFEDANCWLEERIAHPDEPQAFLEASTLAPIRELLPDEAFQPFSDRMMEVMGQPENFNYVRLNIEARRA
ncbi:MAG: methyltransferase domain-containing protein [Solirubrobacterales bacterium]